jgi:ClpP class serine protease
VGVVATFGLNERQVSVTSTNAPKKRPDVTTEAGKAVVREQLDAMHEVFIDAIATGRKTTVERINADFGEGAVLLAKDALKNGMIDEIISETASISAGTKYTIQKDKSMDLTTLKAQHPEVYSAAVEQGKKQEHERACAHLTMGAAAGALDVAVNAITDNVDPSSPKAQAEYMAARLNRSDQMMRQSDDADVSATDGVLSSEEDVSEKVGADILREAATACNVDLTGSV